MCRWLSILLFSILPIVVFGQDDGALAVLDTKVDEYLAALERESVDVKCTETDFIISSCTDSAVLTRVANRVYDHYHASRLMGDDAVAIHVYDTWFADRAVKMNSEEDYFEATFFAATNRNSLIGRKAPKLELYTPENEPFTIFEDSADHLEDLIRGEAVYKILFFYEVGCPVCMAETAALGKILEKHPTELTLYAVYVGTDAEKWVDCRRERFDSVAEIIHLWDPELKSGLAFDYGVIGTPRLFLISPDGTIIGRGLDSAALETLLDKVLGTETLEYGSQEAMDLYDSVFEDSEPCANVGEVAAHIEEMLLPRGDTLLFKQMVGDLLYFLTARKQARFKCASEAFIDGFILNRPDVWNTADDSLQVVSLGVFVKELLNLCPLGEKLPALEVPVEVLTRKGNKTTTLRLDRQKNCVIMFYTEGCGLCVESLEAARNAIETGTPVSGTAPSKIILIDMDEIWSMEGDLPEELMLNFDLSSLPFILCLDEKGRTACKYADFN